jgi:sugar lactone lactonase YvrE
MRYDQQPGEGTLYRLDPGTGHPKAVPVLGARGLCNGIGWSPDATTMYFVDTLAHRVDAHRYDTETARMGPARALCEIDPGDGVPDGGGQVRRYLPDGRLDEIVDLAVPEVTCPAFGGAGMDRLYVTTARADGVSGSGGLWVADPGIVGLAATLWRR